MTPHPLIVCAAAIEGRGVADAVLGVGKTAAAMRATELLIKYRPAWLLLIGVCGAYQASAPQTSLAVGDLCVVGEDRLADEGVALADGFQGIARMGLGDEGPFRSDLARAQTIASRLGIPIVSGATVSTCSGCDDLATALARRSGAQVETMEGAAVLQVCHHLKVPAVQLRCVSNRTGDRARAGWDLPRAVERLAEAVRTLANDWAPKG
jgi:futalosine hydrolase